MGVNDEGHVLFVLHCAWINFTLITGTNIDLGYVRMKVHGILITTLQPVRCASQSISDCAVLTIIDAGGDNGMPSLFLFWVLVGVVF